MKIDDVRVYITWGAPRNWVLVKITTDKGLYGWGEATLEGNEETVAARVREFAAQLIGEDALAVEHHWQRLYRHHFWRGGPVSNSALSGIDQALWDLRGKAWGVPVYQLLGGPVRSDIRLYTHVGIYDPGQLEVDAQRDMTDGFTAMKTGAWQSDNELPEHRLIEAFTERVMRLRHLVGQDVDLMIDNHGRSRASAAARLMHALAPARLFWFEEPTPPDDLDALARLRVDQPPMDIAAGERLYSKWDYTALIDDRLVDVIQPDLCHCGGITECKKVAAYAETRYIQVAPHNPQGPVSTAAAAHLGMAIPNFLILEYVRSPHRERVLREPWIVQNGRLQVPDRPGLGVEIDEAAVLSSPMRSFGKAGGAWASDGSVADV